MKDKIINILLDAEFSREWCGNFFCPSCNMSSDRGHGSDCDLQAVLTKLRDVKTKTVSVWSNGSAVRRYTGQDKNKYTTKTSPD